MDGERYLTAEEAAQILKVNVQTLRKWLRDGEIRGRLIGSARSGYRIAESEVEYVLKNGKRAKETDNA